MQLMGLQASEPQPTQSQLAQNAQLIQNSLYTATQNQPYGKSPTMANRAAISPRLSFNIGNQLAPGTLIKVTKKQQRSSMNNNLVTEMTPILNSKKVVKLSNVQLSTPVQQSNGASFIATASKRAMGIVASTSKKRKMTGKALIGQEKSNTGTETDTFSQIISIHQNQEELLDFEQFIKGENVKFKLYEQQLRETSGKGDMEDDEDSGGGSDSSADSDESSKNLLVQQTLHQQQQLAKQINKSINPARKQIKKSVPPVKKQIAEESDEVYRSLEIVKKQKRSGDATSLQAPRQPITHGMEAFKFRPVGKNVAMQNQAANERFESRQNHRIANKTQSKANRDGEFQFDKIPHRHSQSPRNEDIDLAVDEIGEESKSNASSTSFNQIVQTPLEEEVIEKVTPNKEISGQYLKSFEEMKQYQHFEKPKPQQHILPLYENALYHQNRLGSINSSQDRKYFQSQKSNVPSTNANILYHNVKAMGNHFQFRNSHQSQYQDPYSEDPNKLKKATMPLQPNKIPIAGSVPIGGFQKHPNSLVRPSTQQEQPSMPITNATSRLVIAEKLGTHKDHMMNPIIANELEELSRKVSHAQNNRNMHQPYQKEETSQQHDKGRIRIDQISNRQSSRQTGGAHQIGGGETNSVQRISFKELLESSRQQRIIGGGRPNPTQTNTTIKNYNPKVSQGHITQYNNDISQKLKNQYISQTGGSNLSLNQADGERYSMNTGPTEMAYNEITPMYTEDQINHFDANLGEQKGTSIYRKYSDGGITPGSKKHKLGEAFTHKVAGSLQNTHRGNTLQPHIRAPHAEISHTPNIIVLNRYSNCGVEGKEKIASGDSSINNHNFISSQSAQYQVKIEKSKAHQSLFGVLSLFGSQNTKNNSDTPALSQEEPLQKAKTAISPQKRIRLLNIGGKVDQTSHLVIENQEHPANITFANQRVSTQIPVQQLNGQTNIIHKASFQQQSMLKVSNVTCAGGGFIRKDPVRASHASGINTSVDDKRKKQK